MVAEVAIGIGEETGGHDVAGVELHGLVQGLDGILVFLLFAQRAAQAHPGGEIRGIDAETGAQDLFGLGEVPGPAQLLGELVEEPALRIRLQTESKLFDFGIRCRLSHLSDLNSNRTRREPPREGAVRR